MLVLPTRELQLASYEFGHVVGRVIILQARRNAFVAEQPTAARAPWNRRELITMWRALQMRANIIIIHPPASIAWNAAFDGIITCRNTPTSPHRGRSLVAQIVAKLWIGISLRIESFCFMARTPLLRKEKRLEQPCPLLRYGLFRVLDRVRRGVTGRIQWIKAFEVNRFNTVELYNFVTNSNPTGGLSRAYVYSKCLLSFRGNGKIASRHIPRRGACISISMCSSLYRLHFAGTRHSLSVLQLVSAELDATHHLLYEYRRVD